jgi:hypothetical protein
LPEPAVLPTGLPVLCVAPEEPVPIDPDDWLDGWLPDADVPLSAEPLVPALPLCVVPALPLCAAAALVHVIPTADRVRPSKTEVLFILDNPPAEYDGGPLPEGVARPQRS